LGREGSGASEFATVWPQLKAGGGSPKSAKPQQQLLTEKMGKWRVWWATPGSSTFPISVLESLIRRGMNIELNHRPKFERLVLGCIDAAFASKY
jgi:hypothetical protein